MRVYECTQCDWVLSAETKGAIGTAHAHAEKHVGVEVFGFELPAWLLPVANPERLDEVIREVEVDDYQKRFIDRILEGDLL